MGIWPDDSDRTDINSTCRSSRGAPVYIPPKDKNVSNCLLSSQHDYDFVGNGAQSS
jgi:hypothetical protein